MNFFGFRMGIINPTGIADPLEFKLAVGKGESFWGMEIGPVEVGKEMAWFDDLELARIDGDVEGACKMPVQI